MANKDKLTHLMKLAAPFIAGVSGDVNAETVDRELQALLLALETHKGSADHDNDSHVWSAFNRFLQTVEVAGLLPITGDTADIGAPTRLFRKGYFSELSSLILRKENLLVMDGSFVLTKQSGKFVEDVGASDTQVDFGQAMTTGDYLILRAENKVEYMQVGALVDGTRYNVTRNLDGSGANKWPAESVYSVRGHAGEGWLELTAADDQRFSLFVQGQNWNQSKEIVRIGELTDWQSAGLTGYGLAIGDFAANEYMRFCTSDQQFFLSGTFSAANNLVKLWEYGLDLFTTGAGVRFFKVLTDNLPVGIVQLGFDPVYPNRTWLDVAHDRAVNVTGGSVSEDGAAVLSAIGGVSGGASTVLNRPGEVEIRTDGVDSAPGMAIALFNRLGLTLDKDIAAANISQTPTANGIPKAGANGKLDSGWIDQPTWQDYSVQWQASGTNPSIGNGILLGRYCKVGKICTVKIFLRGGSTTNWGSGDYTFSLPFTIYGPNGMLCNIGMARIRKPGAGNWTRLIASYGSFDYLKYFIDITNGTDINTLTPTSPTTLGSGNYIDIQISYEVE